MLAVYVGSLLFGGLLIAATVVGGAGHAGDVHAGGDTDQGGGGHGWLWLFGLRFWSFGAAFFGLTGLVLGAIGGAGWAAVVPWISGGAGAAAGLAASSAFRLLGRDAVGELGAAGTLIGREGRLLLPAARAQPGKVRLALPGGQVDLVAEAAEDEPLPAGAAVLVVEIRGNVAVVARVPASLPAPAK